MSADIKEFFFEEKQQVRSILIDKEPWFIASDVAKILSYRDASNMTRLLDTDEKGTHLVSTPGGTQKMSTISEPGLYLAIMRSDSRKARSFQRWVTHEILPSIRKTGSFATPLEDLSVEQILERLEVAGQKLAHTSRYAIEEIRRRNDVIAALVKENKILKPKAEAQDKYLNGPAGYSVKEAASILRSEGIFWGDEILLHAFLRDTVGWTYYNRRRDILPNASAQTTGYVTVREYRHKAHVPQVLLTAKGMEKLRSILPALMVKHAVRITQGKPKLSLEELK